MFKVLIADDERMVKRTLRVLIETEIEGFAVIGEAKDGEQALRMAEESEPDLIITDVRMPVRDGLQLIQELTARQNTAEFIIISGYDDFTYAQTALRYGVADYLLKPIDPSYFISVLQKIKTRLQQKEHQPFQLKEWFWDCKTQAEKMAAFIWDLNQSEVVAELARIDADIRNNHKHNPVDLLGKYDYFWMVIEGELQQLNHDVLLLPPFPPLQGKEGAEQLCESIRTEVCKIMEQIRTSRNWWNYNRVMKNAMELVEMNYTDPAFTLKDAATHLKISPYYFGNLFKKTTGISFAQYVTNLRIEKAKELFQNPYAKVYEIAQSVGFEDYTYFSKTFKKVTGSSPSEYRRR
jgi:two-component system response regulator YesN